MSAPASSSAVSKGPEKCISPKKDAAKAAAAASQSSVTAKGNRRVQGWHSAVGGNAPPPPLASNPSTSDAKSNISLQSGAGITRRTSVQFSKEALDHPSGTRAPKPRQGGATTRDDTTDFRQSMADFLTVMYGDKTASTAVGAGGKDGGSPPAKAKSAAVDGKPAPGAPAPAGRGPRPSTVVPSSTGPQVKGLTANAGHPLPHGDRIDTLVETLVRAYSRKTNSARGDFHGTVGADDDPIVYNRGRTNNYRRAMASPRASRASGLGGHDANEVSVFVSQAMDNILGPGGAVSSNRSVLSSLGLDKNFTQLMSFQTKSNLNDVVQDEEDSDTVLEPMYVGEQALFRSVGTRPNMNDISVSKSMRGMIPPLPAPPGGGGPVMPTRRPSALTDDKMSLDSAEVLKKASGANTRAAGGVPRANAMQRGAALVMSLDSKALGGAGGGEDDSWGDEPAGALAAKAAEAGSPAVVSSARSLLDYSRARASATVQKALDALEDEEQLKRDVVIAVEHQLRGYIVSLESEETGKPGRPPRAGAGRRFSGEGSLGPLSPGTRGPRAKPPLPTPAADSTAPLMQNVMDFLQEGASGTNRSHPSTLAATKN